MVLGAEGVAAWVRAPTRPWPGRVGALLVAVLVTAPVLTPGYVLLRDMVFVPRQYLVPAALGLGVAPRAVPVDAVMAALTAVVPGQIVQKLALVGAVYAAALGAGRLVPADPAGRRGPAAAVAGLAYGWSPYVAERLLMGHWSLLVGYGALPWVVAAGLRLRPDVGVDRRGALASLVLAMAPAALTPTGALLAGAAAAAAAGPRRMALVLGVTTGLALPWLVAGLLDPGAALSGAGSAAAFAVRSENWAGTLVAVLGTGGIWNAAAVPASRGLALSPLITAALVGLAVLGLRTWPRAARGLLVLAGAGLVVAMAGATPGLADGLEAIVTTVPGGGLLRDGQKWIAWWALVLALGAGAGTRVLLAALQRWGEGQRLRHVVVAAAVLLPVFAVPDLVWGVSGRLHPVEFPDDWARVAAVVAADPAPGAVLLAPFAAQRTFAWNDGRVQLDPAPRYLPRTTVGATTLTVDGRPVDVDDQRSATVLAAADDPAALAADGIGWVLVEHGTPGPPVPAWIAGRPPVFAGPWLTLVRVPGTVVPAAPGPLPSVAALAAHLIALIGVAVALGWRLRSTWVGPRGRPRGMVRSVLRRR